MRPIISFELNKNLYVRDPQQSELGQRIIHASTRLIDELGFEHFTFKKLADEIQSTEASVYRYFENKHRLLIYLIDGYWTLLEYRIENLTTNIKDPTEKLRCCLDVLTETKKNNPDVRFAQEESLQRIAIAEFEKTYHTKQIDSDNEEGLFIPYKSVCKKITSFVKAINPDFPYPNTLVSTLMLSVNHQSFYAEHLPSLTDIRHHGKNSTKQLREFLEKLVFNTIKN